MIFEQFYLDCLSHASYLVGDETTGGAVVVDPQRDVSGYVAAASAAGLRIERVIETHVHADFVSGHLELAAATGATISYGAGAPVEFAFEALNDGQRIALGEVELEIRATPGHTPESICVVVYDLADAPEPWGVLTGDTLFIGDVGRPDLLAAAGQAPEDMARSLYRSLRTQLLPLPDATRIFPAHGAGSACGKQLSTETTSTLGEQRRSNYALQPMSEDEFVAVVTEGQTLAPGYFSFDAARNREDRPLLDESEPPLSLGVEAVESGERDGVVLLDTRDVTEFAGGHVRGSVNVPLTGRFAEWAGDVIRPNDEIILVSEPGTEREAKLRLARIGFDHVRGALQEPYRMLTEHPGLVERASRLTVTELKDRLALDTVQVVDVRPATITGGDIADAQRIPLEALVDRLDGLDPGAPTVAICATGARSPVAASVLRAQGFLDVSDVIGGYAAWNQEDT